MNKLKLFLLIFSASLFAACGKDDDGLSDEAQLAKDIEIIQTYLTDKGLTAQSTASGLHYLIEVEGTGGHPSINDEVSVFYQGYFTDEVAFDWTGRLPATFLLGNVIKGWKEGIPLFKRGGKGRLFLPSSLAYGKNPPSGIPANAVLIFDVELLLNEAEQLEKDTQIIQAYLTEKGISAQSAASGLHYLIEVEGADGHPTTNDVVTVNYKGYFTDGVVFDETDTSPVSFPLSNTIRGWREGIPLFQKGGKGKLFVPSGLGYGIAPPQGIPVNSVLIFDVEVIDF